MNFNTSVDPIERKMAKNIRYSNRFNAFALKRILRVNGKGLLIVIQDREFFPIYVTMKNQRRETFLHIDLQQSSYTQHTK